MLLNSRRIHKCRCAQLLTAAMFLCLLMVSWDELDYHVVSHVRSYTYRYLVNRYDFLNSSFAASSGRKAGVASYPYLINHPGKCRGGAGWDEVLLLLFVKSSPENFRQRQDIRDTWGNVSFARSQLGASVRVLFAVGVCQDAGRRSSVQEALLEEDRLHGDVVQQSFRDTFHNLTAKLLLQLHWSQVYCPQARFLMSADDDVFVHMPNLVRYLKHQLRSRWGGRDLWVGHVHRGSPPVRRKDSKYHVSYQLYPWPSYPDYTAGAGYVVSRDVAAKIYEATLQLSASLHIDDVFMGVCAKAAGVSPRDHGYFSGEGKAPYHPCIYEHMITSHGHTSDLRSLWKKATAGGGEARGFLGSLYCTAVRVALLCVPRYQRTYSCGAAFT